MLTAWVAVLSSCCLALTATERIRYSETGDIEADWDTDKQQWRGGQVNAGCEICQFIVYDVAIHYEKFTAGWDERAQEMNDWPPEELLQNKWEQARQILEKQCKRDHLSRYAKIALLNWPHPAAKSAREFQFCASLTAEGARSIVKEVLVDNAGNHSQLSHRLCYHVCDGVVGTEDRERIVTLGYWEKDEDIPDSSARQNTPWMRRWKQGVDFFVRAMKLPNVKTQKRTNFLYRVLKKAPKKLPNGKLRFPPAIGDVVTVMWWARNMHQGGRFFENTFASNSSQSQFLPGPQKLQMGVFPPMVHGHTEVLRRMLVGDSLLAILPSELAFAFIGADLNQPPLSTVMMEVHLLGIERAPHNRLVNRGPKGAKDSPVLDDEALDDKIAHWEELRPDFYFLTLPWNFKQSTKSNEGSRKGQPPKRTERTKFKEEL
mmetsp:Transcript_42814/g.83933  ORF Transcript_42814/g.83933 Transcript_42814/m.83933 type:complete len:431 (+) Transcript_42814:32-1324(+)